MRVRQSMLNTWMTCPLQAKFQYIDLLPRRQNAKASYGTIIHYCLEQYHYGMSIDACVDLFHELWNEPERLGVTPDYYPKGMSYNTLRQEGGELLRTFHERNKWEKRKVLKMEHRFLVPFGDHEIEGTVDMLDIKKNGRGRWTVRIVDFKTNARQPTLNALRMNIQFTAYIYASHQREFWVGHDDKPEFPGIPNGEQMFEDFRKAPRQGVWVQLMNNAKELNAGDRDDDDYMRLYRLTTEIEKAVKNNVFVPTINADSCLFCDFTEPCGVRIPSQEELKEIG